MLAHPEEPRPNSPLRPGPHRAPPRPKLGRHRVPDREPAIKAAGPARQQLRGTNTFLLMVVQRILRTGALPVSRKAVVSLYWFVYYADAGWSSLVVRWAHNPQVAGSNPAPATNTIIR